MKTERMKIKHDKQVRLDKPVRLSKFQPKRTFGVEMEWDSRPLSRQRMKALINSLEGEHAIVAGYEHNSDAGKWYCKTDSSCGNEVASRVLGSFSSIRTTIDDLKKVTDVHELLVLAGARINERCGGHVHISLGDFDNDQAARALRYWVKFEKFIFEMLPSRRTHDNSYCRAHSAHFRSNREYDLDSVRRGFSGRNSLNLGFFNWNSDRSGVRLVEVRCGEATEDSRCLKNWVRFVLHFFESVKHLPNPENLHWFTLKEGLRTLNLFPHKQEEGPLVLSPALSELREWILTRISCYANFKNAEEQRKRAKDLQAELYPTPFGVKEENNA